MDDIQDGQTENSTSSADATLAKKQPEQDIVKNLKGEFNRKISKLENMVASLIETQSGNKQAKSVDETVSVDTDVKQYVSSVLTEQKQMEAYQQAIQMFPELNPESDDFDEKFYKAVDAEFSSNSRKDPRGPLKAAKLVALELGKIDQLTKASLYKDDARRARIVSEGTAATKEARKEKDVAANFNANALAKLGIKDPAKLAKRIKDNKDKYGA